MRIGFSVFFVWVCFLSFAQDVDLKMQYENMYSSTSKPEYNIYLLAIKGYDKLGGSESFSNHKLTVIDFRLPSTQKRLWVIDLDQNKVIFHSLVAHGKGTGENLAKKFSNKPNSHQSSLGFYKTGTTYHGKHGLSLYLDGLEPGINDKARERYIVMHGANYVSKEFISKYGRLGRSFGCPAVPVSKHKAIITAIKEGSCLFIFSKDVNYKAKSVLIN